MSLQTIVVLALISLAVFALVRRLRRMARGQALCGKCPGCGDETSRCEAEEPPAST